MLFDVIPTFVDIAIALIVFAIKLDWMLTVVTFSVVSAYGALRLSSPIFRIHAQLYTVIATVVLTRWRTRLRRAMNDRDAVRSDQLTLCDLPESLL